MVDANTLQRIAELSALRLDDPERALHELNEVIAHVACLSEVDTEGVEPYAGTLTRSSNAYAGTVFSGLNKTEHLSVAPDEVDSLFSERVVE